MKRVAYIVLCAAGGSVAFLGVAIHQYLDDAGLEPIRNIGQEND